MPISVTLPLLEDKPSSLKDVVFTILTTKFPLSLTEITHILKRNYHQSPSFQSVRKAVLGLLASKVLIKESKKFSINKDWILNVMKFGSLLHRQYFAEAGNKTNTRVELSQNVAIYTFSSLVDLDAVWNTIIEGNFADNSSQPKKIIFQATHFWFVLATLAQETELIKNMIKKGISLYYVCFGKTAIDKWTIKYYNDLGVHSKAMTRPKDFKEGYNLGVYGDLVIYTTHPKEITKKLDEFFSEHDKIEKTNLSEFLKIISMKTNIQLTVVKNPVLARTIRESVINNFSV